MGARRGAAGEEDEGLLQARLEIRFENGVFQGRWSFDGAAPLDVSLTLPQSQRLRAETHEFYQAFESASPSPLSLAEIRRLGQGLLRPWWRVLGEADGLPGSPWSLAIESASAEALALPWEIAATPAGDFLSLGSGVERRLVGAASPAVETAGSSLRVLFLTASPDSLPDLDCEREQDAFFRLASRPGGSMTFEMAESAAFHDFSAEVRSCSPEIVHLSGHGEVRGGEVWFHFEGLDGSADPVPVDRLTGLLRESGVRLVLVNACQSARQGALHALGGICQGLIQSGIPYAVGWAGPIQDDLAILFAERFYRMLGQTGSVRRAMVAARKAVFARLRGQGMPFWALPVLYTRLAEPVSFVAEEPVRDSEPRAPVLLRPGSLLGRRREIRRVLTHFLREAGVAAFLCGLPGMGKSALMETLAGPLAERLDLEPVRIGATEERPLTRRIFLDELSAVFRNHGREDVVRALQVSDGSLEQALAAARRALAQYPLLVLLENLELTAAEEPSPGEPAARFPPLWELLGSLLEDRTGRSRYLITGSCQPFSVLPQWVLPVTLSEISAGAALRLLLRDAIVRRRVAAGDLPGYLLSYLVCCTGGMPGLLLKVREELRTIRPEALEAELAEMFPVEPFLPDLPPLLKARGGETRATTGVIAGILKDHDAAASLSGRLDLLSETQVLQLTRGSIFRVPVRIEGWMLANMEPRADAFRELLRDGASLGLILETASPSAEPRYQVVTLLRNALLAGLVSSGRATAAHLAAATFHAMAAFKNPPWEERSDWLAEDMTWGAPGDLAADLSWREYFTEGWEAEWEEAFFHFAADSNEEGVSAVTMTIVLRLLERQRTDRAEVYLEHALRITRDPDLLELQASICQRRGDTAGVVRAYEEIAGMAEAGRLCSPLRARIELAYLRAGSAGIEALAALGRQASSSGDRAAEIVATQYLAALLEQMGDPSSAQIHRERLRLLEAQEEADPYVETLRSMLSAIDLNPQAGALHMVEALVERGSESFTRVNELEIAGHAASFAGEQDHARVLFNQALDLARRFQSSHQVLGCLKGLADLDLADGRLEPAVARLSEGLHLATRLQDGARRRQLLIRLAEVRRLEGNPSESRELLERVLRETREAGDASEIEALERLTALELSIGNLARAEVFARQAVELARGLQNPELYSRLCGDLVDVLAKQGDLAQAESVAEDTLAQARAAEDPEAVFNACHRLGHLLLDAAKAPEARSAFEEARGLALEMAKTKSGSLVETYLFASTHGLGRAEQALGLYEPARQHLSFCVTQATSREHRRVRAVSCSALAHLELDCGNEDEALRLLRQARDLFCAQEETSEAAECMYGAAMVHLGRENDQEARQALEEALSLLAKAAETDLEAEAHVLLALSTTWWAGGQPDAALPCLEAAWQRIDDGSLEDLRRPFFEEFLEVAAQLGRWEVALSLMGLLVAMHFDEEAESAREILAGFFAIAEDYGLDAEAEDLLERASESWFHERGANLIPELLNNL